MAVTTSKSTAAPRWKTIHTQLRSELSGYAYGSAFYSIADICRKFEVSKITAIRVLDELAAEGLLEKIRGKGNVVRKLTQTASVRLIVSSTLRQGLLSLEPVSRRLYQGLQLASERVGVDLDTLSESHLPRLFPRQNQSFGFLVFRGVGHKAQRFLRKHQLPHVYLDPLEQYKGITCARVDRVRSGYIATRHLLDRGHKRIAWITGPTNQRNFRDRLKGYRDALHEAGLGFKWSLIQTSDGNNPDQDDLALDNLLRMRRRPTAIIAGDDNRGIHILSGCRDRGIRVPDDICVVGYPNLSESSLTDPPLTVVDPLYEDVSAAAIKLLLEQMHGKAEAAGQQAIIEPQLIVRASTGPISIGKNRKPSNSE